MKKRQWSIRRTTTQALQAQRRWDRAYQQVLQWSAPPVSLTPTPSQEKHEEHRSLRPRLDPTTSADPDNRTATRQLTDLS